MKLYRLQRKSDKKYLNSCDHRLHAWSGFNGSFSSSGAFWKRIDTVKNHVKVLCSEYKRTEEYRASHVAGAGYYYTKFTRTAFHPERAELYCVECLDVTVDGAIIIEAKDLLK